jgi:hypothetical protein
MQHLIRNAKFAIAARDSPQVATVYRQNVCEHRGGNNELIRKNGSVRSVAGYEAVETPI